MVTKNDFRFLHTLENMAPPRAEHDGAVFQRPAQDLQRTASKISIDVQRQYETATS